jgi:transposase
MRAGIALRPDYDAARLRGVAKATRNGGQSRRLLALAEIYDGGSRTKAARIGGVGLQTVRDWVVRFNARGPDGLIDGKAPGNARKLNDSQRQVLVNIGESGPMPAIHGVVRWRLKDLTLWIWEEFQISRSETTLSRELRGLGYRTLSARPRHYAQDPEALEAFKKASRPNWRRSGRASRTAPPRAVVAGRGAGRPEEQDRPPLGSAGHPPPRSARPENQLGLDFRGDLPARGQGRGPGPAAMRYAGDEPASRPSKAWRKSRKPWPREPRPPS